MYVTYISYSAKRCHEKDKFVDLEVLFQDTEATVVSVNGTETGQIIVTSIGGQNGQPKQVDIFWLIYKQVCAYIICF